MRTIPYRSMSGVPLARAPGAADKSLPRDRGGFTLIELIVVISILLVLTSLVVMVFNAGSGAEKIRTAARTAQSALLGARDRALHAGELRGVRMIRDANDPTLVTGFAYIQEMPSLVYPAQSIQLERPDYDSDAVLDSTDVLIVRGFADPASFPTPPTPNSLGPAPWTDWHLYTALFSNPPRIRIPADGTGQWYTFKLSTAAPYQLSEANQYLELSALTPFVNPGTPGQVAFTRASSNSSCEIELAPDLLPHHSPIVLSGGIVIDLDFSSPTAAAPAFLDIMFSPRGMVAGRLAGLGPIYLLLNDVRDAALNLNPIDPANKGDKLILAIFPQTGHVGTYPIDPTDLINNSTGLPGADNQADNLFRYAQTGNPAGL